MKRKDIIEKLLSEGFSQKTLITLNDKSIRLLGKRFLSEQSTDNSTTTYMPKEKFTPEKKAAVKAAKETVVTYEEKEIGKDDEVEKKPLKKKTKVKDEKIVPKKKTPIEEKKKVGKWVDKLVENKYYSFATKNEIMSLIEAKINEQGVAEPMIPTKKPVTKPTTKPGKPEQTPGKKGLPNINPFDPSPLKDPNPKLKKERVFELPDFLKYDNIVASVKTNKNGKK